MGTVIIRTTQWLVLCDHNLAGESARPCHADVRSAASAQQAADDAKAAGWLAVPQPDSSIRHYCPEHR